MASPLTIWSNASFPDHVTAELEERARPHRLIFDSNLGSNLSAGGADPRLAEADIAFGQPDPDQVVELSNLKWVHITSAGYTRYDRDDLRAALRARGAAFTNSSSVFDEPCAQHLLAFMLAEARQIPQSYKAQLEGNRWAYDDLRGQTRLLSDQKVLILSFGAIARRLVELLAPFRLQVSAVRQTVRGDEPIPTYPITELEARLADADHVVNILPASPSTDRLMDASKFNAMKRGARFYNMGRGTTVDQPALIEALESGQVGCAYLDVTDPEPLPSDHPLWNAPNCYITPHIGGGFATEHERTVEHFLTNLRRFENGETLTDRIV